MKRIGMHQCVVIYDDAIIINYCKITIIYLFKTSLTIIYWLVLAIKLLIVSYQKI